MEPHWGGASRVKQCLSRLRRITKLCRGCFATACGFDRALDARARPTCPLRLDTALKTLFLDRFQKGLQLDCGKARRSIAHGVGDHDQIVVD